MSIYESVDQINIPQRIVPSVDYDPSNPLIAHRNRLIDQYGRALIGRELPYDSGKLEYESPIGDEARREFTSLVCTLPNRREIIEASPWTRRFSKVLAEFGALDMLYTGPNPETDGTPEDILWARMISEVPNNAMAVRNRLYYVKKIVSEQIDKRLQTKDSTINILSIAAGSCRGILEVMAKLKPEDRARVKLRITDFNQEAVDYARNLAKVLGIEDELIETMGDAPYWPDPETGKVKFFEDGYESDITEIAGLVDYVWQEPRRPRVVTLLRNVRDHLTKGGCVVYTNIAPNDEGYMTEAYGNKQGFTHVAVGWPKMHYRYGNTIYNYAVEAGFKPDDIDIIEEPLKLYNHVLASK